MNESRMANSSKNVITSIIFQFTKIALVFANRIIFVNLLGATYLGINGLFSNILNVLSIADLGITTAMMYSLYKPLAEGDTKKITGHILFFKKVYNVISIVVFLIGVLLLPFLKYIINLPENIKGIYVYYIILVLNTSLSYLFIYKTTLLSADQKMYVLNKYDILMQFVLFIVQMCVLVFTKSFLLYLIANLICTVLGNTLKARKVKQIYPYIGKGKEEITPKEKKEVYNNVKSLFLYKIGSVVQGNTDNILISIFAGTLVVGYYSNYTTIILAVTSLVTLVFNGLKASFGNYIAKNSKENQLSIFYKMELYNFFVVSLCSTCLINLMTPFIKICFGQDYVMSNSILILSVLYFYIKNSRQTIWMYRETTGLFNKTKYISLVTSVLNLVLSIVLGYFYGINGVLGATILASFMYAWWKEPIILFKNYFKANPKRYYCSYILRLILTILINMLVYIISISITINNIYIRLIFNAFLCVVIPLIIVYLVYRKTEAYEFLLEKLKTLKGRKNG